MRVQDRRVPVFTIMSSVSLLLSSISTEREFGTWEGLGKGSSWTAGLDPSVFGYRRILGAEKQVVLSGSFAD
jgi:hypothetical protein